VTTLTTADGRTLKMLNVIDEFTREALAVDVDRGIDADGVVEVLDRLALEHGAPHYVRFDNGPEFVAHAVNDWCRFTGTGSLFIDLGSPWQNAWIESFNGRLRDELLNSSRFDSLLEARVIIEDWRRDYNANRPHTAHGDLTESPWKCWRLLTLETRMQVCRKNSLPGSRRHADTVPKRRPPRCDGAGIACRTGYRAGNRATVARQLGYGVESVRMWVRQADIDEGLAPGVSTAESARVKELEQENRELKRANEILKRAASFFGAELDRQHKK